MIELEYNNGWIETIYEGFAEADELYFEHRSSCCQWADEAWERKEMMKAEHPAIDWSRVRCLRGMEGDDWCLYFDTELD